MTKERVPDRLVLDNGLVRLVIDIADGAPYIACLTTPEMGEHSPPTDRLPLVEVQPVDEGRRGLTSALRHVDGNLSHRLRYRDHWFDHTSSGTTLGVAVADAHTGLVAEQCFRVEDGVGVVSCETTVRNDGTEEVLLEFVSSFSMTGFAEREGATPWDQQLRVWIPHSGWLAECQWKQQALTDAGISQVVSPKHDLIGSQRRLAVNNTGTWSASDYLPMGMVEDPVRRLVWAWQIEHNGSWHWELGDRHRDLYLVVSGPTDQEHQWRRRLAPGESFTAVPVAVIAVAGGFDEAIAALTEHRRRRRRPHRDNTTLPVIYNDFFNLWADPTTEKLLPVIDAAADAGAEVFCIDAGWHDDNEDWESPGGDYVLGVPWWDALGDWTPAKRRFAGGLGAVLDYIRDKGMVPGLWVEPEVAGIRSALAGELPAKAFFHRHGLRVQDRGRYQLDLRHPQVLKYLDAAIDNLVTELGVGYLKFDYNIDLRMGTDIDAHSPGDGLLQHNRAVLHWLQGLLDRHPGLVIEGCASGGARLDYGMLNVLPMQSTSDQKDPLLYSAIAAAASTAVTPEQGGAWAIPEPAFDNTTIAYTMTNALMGRVLLSGRLQQLTAEQLALVREAIDSYKALRHHLPATVPFWPLGPPGWHDPWLCVGLRSPGHTQLALWRRHGDLASIRLPLTHLPQQEHVRVHVAYPRAMGAEASWDPERSEVQVHLPQAPGACLVILDAPACP